MILGVVKNREKRMPFKDIGETFGAESEENRKFYPTVNLKGEKRNVGDEVELTFKAKVTGVREDNDGISSTLELRSIKDG